MTLTPKTAARLQFLSRVVDKECRHLLSTDRSLFETPFTIDCVKLLESDQELSERVEAFVGRFGRLQDTLGDKLLPVQLIALGETSAAAIDNLDKAERLGLIASTDQWLTMRNLRNQMVNEYIEDPVLFATALQTGHDFVPELVSTANKLIAEIQQRGWAS